MKRVLIMAAMAGAVTLSACTDSQKQEAQRELEETREELRQVQDELKALKGDHIDDEEKTTLDFTDRGGEIVIMDIEKYTKRNENFRTTMWTGDNIQMTLMNIPVGGEIGKEIHHTVEQFIRIEAGKGMVLMGKSENEITFQQKIEDDEVVFIPKGLWHNIKNIGDEPLKLYSIYGPPEHAKGTIHETMEEGHAHDHDH